MSNYEDIIINHLENKEHNVGKEKYIRLLKKKYAEYKNICIFPMGIEGTAMLDKLKCQGINVDFFCDNDPKKVDKVYKGTKCISLEELYKRKDDTIIIISTVYYKEIYNQLLEKGFKNLDRILANKFEVDEYFSRNNVDYIRKNIFELIDILDDDESKRVVCKIIG
jgi:ketol-acid reductoisomerase